MTTAAARRPLYVDEKVNIPMHQLTHYQPNPARQAGISVGVIIVMSVLLTAIAVTMRSYERGAAALTSSTTEVKLAAAQLTENVNTIRRNSALLAERDPSGRQQQGWAAFFEKEDSLSGVGDWGNALVLVKQQTSTTSSFGDPSIRLPLGPVGYSGTERVFWMLGRVAFSGGDRLPLYAFSSPISQEVCAAFNKNLGLSATYAGGSGATMTNPLRTRASTQTVDGAFESTLSSDWAFGGTATMGASLVSTGGDVACLQFTGGMSTRVHRIVMTLGAGMFRSAVGNPGLDSSYNPGEGP